MCYLRFDKAQMTNLQESLYKEMLITNRSGAYCSTTLVGCNIRNIMVCSSCPFPSLTTKTMCCFRHLMKPLFSMVLNLTLACTNTKVRTTAPRGTNTLSVLNGSKCPHGLIVWEAYYLRSKLCLTHLFTEFTYATHCLTPTPKRLCACARSWLSAA